MSRFYEYEHVNDTDIAIIAMSCRFPGADNIEAFWRNLRDGVESISFFSEEELVEAGIDPELVKKPNYVRAKGVLSDVELFDASFFGFSPREASQMDPQHRLFLEEAWKIIETSGYHPDSYEGLIGLYAGIGMNTYLLNNLSMQRQQLEATSGIFPLLIGNDKDYMPTKVSYKLNLKGPSVNVQTACSTSLVATHLACQSLLNGECDMALAGGVSLQIPHKSGYLYQEGMILSPDGHCRAFDAKARGIVYGNGVGLILLKRLADAIADGDEIHAIIKGSAINNDGSLKVAYTAPGVDGQAAVIAEAQAVADVEVETITYIETHGTGTALGDPIEIAALTKAFREQTDKTGFCAIGSVKTNVGHLDTAAGVAGVIKTVLALKHRQIPSSLNFEAPNPQIDFASTPFYVNARLADWNSKGTPRRAGVSSFGFGGTNAHIILEEAPPRQISGDSRRAQLLVLSAKSESALETATTNLATHLQQYPDCNLADVAYTLQVGRHVFNHRRMLVCQDRDEAIMLLKSPNAKQVVTQVQEPAARPVAFLFPGQGAQYVNMARELYETEATFRNCVDDCAELLEPLMGLDLRAVLYPGPELSEDAEQQLQQTAVTQPAIFTIEYALAQLFMEWGIQPQAVIGHSIGEFPAACIAGVFSLEDALKLVAARGQLMQSCAPGAMLSVPLSETEVLPLLNSQLSIAALNAPNQSVVSGPTEAIAALQQVLTEKHINGIRLHTSHAFHSAMMDPILPLFADILKNVVLNPPQIAWVSTVTGKWITTEEVTDPGYWTKNLRQTVRFADGVQQLFGNPAQILLEVGPGRTLSTLAGRHPSKAKAQTTLSSLRHPQAKESDAAFLLTTLGKLWLEGVQINWNGFYSNEDRYRVALPPYPFERKKYWIEPERQLTQEQHLHLEVIPEQIWKSVATIAHVRAQVGISNLENPASIENRHTLDQLAIAYMNHAFQKLGILYGLENTHSLEVLFEQSHIQPYYYQLVTQWIEVLQEQGQWQQKDGKFTNFQPISSEWLTSLLQQVQYGWQEEPELIAFIRRCGENLAAVLIGQREPFTLLFPGNSFDIIERMAHESSLFHYYNAIIKLMIQQLVNVLPSEVGLRILEIGSGTGITTSCLLPILPPNQTSYTFTDISSLLVERARQTFSDYSFVQYKLLDIDQPPQQQGYEPHSFDVIIAANVLHVTKNISQTLHHIYSLLAPKGLLIIWEITQFQPDFAITYSLIMPPVEDGKRSQGNPFLSTSDWHKALHEQGFTEMMAFPETTTPRHHIILAQAASTAAASVSPAFTNLRRQQETPQFIPKKTPDITEWFYLPAWKRSTIPVLASETQHTWLIFIDEHGLGHQLVKRLKQEYPVVMTVKQATAFAKLNNQEYALNPQQTTDYHVLLHELSEQGQIPTKIVHLWTIAPDVHKIPGMEWFEKSQDVGFYSLFFLAQELGKQHITQELQLLVVSNNMQQVMQKDIFCPEKATVLGPIRVIPKEYPNFHCRCIDVILPESGAPEEVELINHLLAECHSDSVDELIAYRQQQRWIQTFEQIRLHQPDHEKIRLRPKGVYLITGGLGGIGLVLAEHLARAVQARLVLLGRSVFPAKEEWEPWLAQHGEQHPLSIKIRKLQALEQLGADVFLLKADVTNQTRMQEVFAQVIARFGQINGVIHAAGVLNDGVIQRKTRELTEQVLAPKVRGALVLETIFKETPLDFFILCSSLASVLGSFGQVDHCAANAFLNTFAHYAASRYDWSVVAINWDVWQEIGQAAELAKQYLATQQSIPAPLSRQKLSHPLFEEYIELQDGRLIYVSQLRMDTQWILNEHRIFGKATIPGTGYLEMIIAAFKHHSNCQTFEIREIYFLAPFMIEEQEKKDIRTILTRVKETHFTFSIESQTVPQQDEWQTHVRGEISDTPSGQPPRKYHLNTIRAMCQEQEFIVDNAHPLQSGYVQYGPRWKNIKRVNLGVRQALISLELPEEFVEDLEIYTLHPALMDSATGFLAMKDKGGYLPFSYKKIIVHGILPCKVYSYIRYSGASGPQEETVTFDITLLDDQEKTLVEIEGYTLRKVEGETLFQRKLSQSLSALDHHAMQPKPDHGKESLEKSLQAQIHLLQQGILSSEGIEVFDRVLGTTLPEIFISTYDLLSRIARNRSDFRSRTVEVERSSKPIPSSYSRPELSSVYVAPETETEQTLTELWQQFLGIKQIGIHDDFFELGGDSLLGTQVMSRIRETFQVELPVGGLFENPTISGLAQQIEAIRWAEQESTSVDNQTLSHEEREEGEI